MPGAWEEPVAWKEPAAWEAPATRRWEAPAAWEAPASADPWAQRADQQAGAQAEDPWAQRAEDPWAKRSDQHPTAISGVSAGGWQKEAEHRPAAANWGAAAAEAPSWGAAPAPGQGMETSDAQKRARQKDFQSYQDWFVQERILPGKTDDEVAKDDRTLFEMKPFQGAGADFSLYDAVSVEISGPNTDAMPSIQTFDELYVMFRDQIPDQLEKNIRSCGYDRPTPVQKYAIPCAVMGRDVMCCAQTGSGKTAAFLVPMLASMIKNHRATGSLKDPFEGFVKPDTLVLTPTRELCLQIFVETQKFCHRTPFRVSRIYGKEPPRTQLEQLAKGADVVVATPGRLWDFVSSGIIDVSGVNCLVLDEADRMIDQGMELWLKDIADNYGMPAKEDRQTMMFSATFPAPIQELAKAYLFNHVWVGVGIVGGATNTIAQRLVKVDASKKYDELYNMLMSFLDQRSSGERLMVFTNSKLQAKGLDEKLWDSKIDTGALHGDLTQEDRENNLQKFRDGAIDVLICTDVASRGLDIGGVSHIVNYDLPREIEVYVQRIGRTGRIGHRGEAISFVAIDAQGKLQEEERMLRDLVPTMRNAKSDVPDWLQAHYDGVDSSWTDGATWWERDGARQDARAGNWEDWSVAAPVTTPAPAPAPEPHANGGDWSVVRNGADTARYAVGQQAGASAGSWSETTRPAPGLTPQANDGNWAAPTANDGSWAAAAVVEPAAANASAPGSSSWEPAGAGGDAWAADGSLANVAVAPQSWGDAAPGGWNAAQAVETSHPPAMEGSWDD